MGISTAYAAVAAALLAALCYAIGAALEQKEASATATQRVVHPGLLWQVLRPRPLGLIDRDRGVARKVPYPAPCVTCPRRCSFAKISFASLI